MGGSFAFFLAWHHPERIAAALAFMPKTCAGFTGDTSPTLTATFERMWSPINVDLPTINGVPVYQWMDGRMLAERYESRGGAPVIGFVGRNDNIVGWQEKVPLFQALNEHRAGGAWYWDGRTHMDPSSQVAWAPEQSNWQMLYHYRIDRSFPALSNCSANSDPGDGSLGTGAEVGNMNGFVQWDDEFVDTRDRWECVLRPRSLQTLAGTLAPPADITVDVTPRRLQHFAVTDRTAYIYTVTDATSGAAVANGELLADAGYLLTVPAVPVRAGGSRVTLQPVSSLAVGDGAGPRLPRLALASNPVHGSTTLQVEWPAQGDARIDLLDAAGRRVRTLFQAPGRGAAAVRLDATGLAPGVYLVHARQGALQSSTRVVVVR
jgi:hypothetical protein